jgi:intracellular septation protein A
MSRLLNRKQLLLGYFGLLFGTVTLALLGERYLKLNGRYLILLLSGLIFLAAVCKIPEQLYQIIRSLGWFRLIEDDSVMNVILLSLGVILILIGLLGLVVA